MTFPHFDPKSRAESAAHSSGEARVKSQASHPLTRFIARLLGQIDPSFSRSPESIKVKVLTEEEASKLAMGIRDDGAGAGTESEDITHTTLEAFIGVTSESEEVKAPASSRPDSSASIATSDPGTSPVSDDDRLSTDSSPTPLPQAGRVKILQRAQTAPEGKTPELQPAKQATGSSSGLRPIDNRVEDSAIRRFNSDQIHYRAPQTRFSIGNLFNRIFGFRHRQITQTSDSVTPRSITSSRAFRI